jgi:hypothetical protein
MTGTERAAIVSRVMQRHLSETCVSEERLRIGANEIRKGFEACGSTPDEIAEFIGNFVLGILEWPMSPEQKSGAIRAMADGFNREISLANAKPGHLYVLVKPRIQH